MWTRKLSFALLALLLCSPPARALSLPLEELSTEELLQRAASSIDALKSLNEDLKKQIARAREHSKDLEAQLAHLTRALENSEKIRNDLMNTLRISEDYWKSSAEEACVKAKLNGILLGVGMGVGVWVVVNLLQ